MWIIIFLSTECVKNFPVDEMEDSLWITGNLMLIKLWIEGWKTEMCKVWKTYIHIIHGVNTGKLEMPTGCTQQNRKLSTRLSTDCG